jgi:hypothetical protein
MAERTRPTTPSATPAANLHPDAPVARHPATARALALQRAVGNRAATQVLQRWAAHPDKDKKGVLMPDEMAAELSRFNPPLSR